MEAVKRIDVLFDIERGIVGGSAGQRLSVRQEANAPVLADLKDWVQAERKELSCQSPVAKTMDYVLRPRELFAAFSMTVVPVSSVTRRLRSVLWGSRSRT